MSEPRDPSRDQIECVIGRDNTPYRIKLKPHLTIGRTSGCDLRLDDPQVAEHHIEVVYDLTKDDYLVTDLHSNSGTYLDNERLTSGQSYIWKPDRVLRLGDNCWFYLKLDASLLELPLSVAIQNLKIEPAEVEPGQNAIISFTLLNQSAAADSFKVSVTGVPDDWLEWVNPPQSELIQIEPGRSKPGKLVIKPPQSAESLAGNYLIRARAVSQRNASQAAHGAETLKITPFYGFDYDPLPLQERGVTQANFELNFINKGNTDLTITLEAQEAQGACVYSFVPNPLVIPAGQISLVQLTARTKEWLPEDGNRSHRFFVTARPDKGRSIQKEGNWEQVQPLFKLKLKPQRVETAVEGKFTLEVSNEGEVELRLTFGVEDASPGCQYLFAPSEVSIPPGDEGKTQLIIQPFNGRRRWLKAKEHSFKVIAHLTEATSITQASEGKWVQLRGPLKWSDSVWLLVLLLLVLFCAWGSIQSLVGLTSWSIQDVTFNASPDYIVEGDNQLVQLSWSVHAENTIEKIAQQTGVGIINWFNTEPPHAEISSSTLGPRPNLPLVSTEVLTVNTSTVFTLTILNGSTSPPTQIATVGGITPTPTLPPTPTPTPSPTLTPTPTSTPTKLPSPTSTPSPSATPTLAATPVPLGGVIYDFETPARWVRGTQPYGSLTLSTEQVHNGSYAGRLDYSFSNNGSDNDGRNNNDYVIFELLPEVALAGQPTEISAWVYGDGSGHYLNVWIRDLQGESWQFTFGRIQHTGWQKMTALLDQTLPWPRDYLGGPPNGIVDYPIRFRGLALDDVPDTYTGTGKIYIDDFISDPVNTLPESPATPPATYDFITVPCPPHNTGSPTETRITAWAVQVIKPGINESLPGYQLKVIGPDGKEHLSQELSGPSSTNSTVQGTGDNHPMNMKVEISPYTPGRYRVYLTKDGQQVSPEVPLNFAAEPLQYAHVHFVKGASADSFCPP